MELGAPSVFRGWACNWRRIFSRSFPCIDRSYLRNRWASGLRELTTTADTDVLPKRFSKTVAWRSVCTDPSSFVMGVLVQNALDEACKRAGCTLGLLTTL